MITLKYKDDNATDAIINTNVEIRIDEYADLTQAFSAFVRMTEIVGYQAKSWEKLIDDLYGYCVLKCDVPENYDIFSYAFDNLNPIC